MPPANPCCKEWENARAGLMPSRASAEP